MTEHFAVSTEILEMRYSDFASFIEKMRNRSSTVQTSAFLTEQEDAKGFRV
jgi:hypothetical protein